MGDGRGEDSAEQISAFPKHLRSDMSKCSGNSGDGQYL
jgi:hypothetical protein